MKVNFAFKLDQLVQTQFGTTGIVKMLAVDAAGNLYFVQTKNGESWHKEAHLSPKR